jgi:hypothetical protein
MAQSLDTRSAGAQITAVFPPQPALASAPRLSEPLWQRQEGESDEEWRAFGAWVDSRDWHRVGALCGLSQQGALELATRWAWHARTRAWDGEKASEAVSDRKAHQEAVQVARRALPDLLRAESDLATSLLVFAHAELVAHQELARAQAEGRAGETRMPYLSLREILMATRVAQQGVRDFAVFSKPIGVESASATPGEGVWDYSSQPPEVLRLIQQARAAARGSSA